LSRFSRADSLHIGTVALIVLAAAVLRFADLPSRGLIYWDEGKFLLEGVRLETGLRILAGAHSSLPAGKAIGTAKPTHALLIALSFAAFGVHDYSALFLNAFAGVVAVVLVYRIATLLFDPTVGVVAALVLAVSEYDVIYSRSALSENDANALLLLGVLLWLYERCRPRSERRSIALLVSAGLAFGLAFTTNYRIVVYVAVIVGFDLLSGSKQRSLSGTVVRAGQWIAGFAIASCVWQSIDFLARARGTVLFRSEITHQSTTYFGEALYQIHGGKQSEVVFGPLPYLQWYVAYQGWILAALLALGMVLALRLRSFAWLAALCPVVVPYLLYIWAPIIVPRNLAAAVPFTAILIAAALVLAVRRMATRQGFLPVLVLLAIVLAPVVHDIQYGPQAAFIAEAFPPRVRYSGASLGYHLASVTAGGPAPIIAGYLLATFGSSLAIVAYIVVCALISLWSAWVLRDRGSEDIDVEAEESVSRAAPIRASAS